MAITRAGDVVRRRNFTTRKLRVSRSDFWHRTLPTGSKKALKSIFLIWAVLLPLGWWAGVAKEETTLTQQRTRAARRFAWLWRHFGHPGPKDQGTGGTGRTTNGKRNRPNNRESHRSKKTGHAIPLFFIHHFFLTTSQKPFVMLRAFPSPLFHLQVRGRYFATNYFQNRQQRATTRTWPGGDAKNKSLFFPLAIWCVV